MTEEPKLADKPKTLEPPRVFDKSKEDEIVREIIKDAEQHRRGDESPSQDDDDAEVKAVNYAYHPIIDFFDRYRWSAAASKRRK